MWITRAVRSLKWLAAAVALGSLVGAFAGAASALFLWILELATATRTNHPVLVYALPLAGLAIGTVYTRIGHTVRGGNNLVIDRAHDGGPQLPRRMAPLVLLGTVLTHLFGGSAGREGTAVQMGGALADALSHALRCAPSTRHMLLCAGIAGGFGSVFGTPIAGCLFALEVLTVGRIDSRALVPALCGALVGDGVTRALGIEHTHFPAVSSHAFDALVAAKWCVLALAVAATVRLFIAATEGLKHALERHVPWLAVRMALGGAMVVFGYAVLRTDMYLGLGVPTIVRAFEDPSLPASAFAWKLVFTSVTLGSGFMGGEVTPLFFIGASLGNALGQALGLPISLAAAVALAATFGAAANTPIALSIMAVELFGAALFPHVMFVSVLAFALTGSSGIYSAQRIAMTKRGRALPRVLALRDAHVAFPHDEDES